MTLRLATFVGAVVLTERRARGMMQSRLALLADLHPMALSKIERGVPQDVGISTLQRIARGLSESPAPPTSAAGLLATAELWQRRMLAHPLPDAATIAGAALAAAVALLPDPQPQPVEAKP